MWKFQYYMLFIIVLCIGCFGGIIKFIWNNYMLIFYYFEIRVKLLGPIFIKIEYNETYRQMLRN